MAKGHVDWGIDTTASVTVSTDTNELAVRLGSNQRISRTGHVYYDTSFLKDLALWKVSVSASGPRALIDRRNGVFEPGCLQIFNSVAADRNITLKRRFPRVNSTKYGLEIIVWFNLNPALFRATITLNNGTNDVIFGIELNSNDDDVKILDSDGVYDSVQSLTITPITTESKWIYVKIIADAENNRYDKVIINNTEITSIVQTPDINVNADLPKVQIDLFADNTGVTTYRLLLGTCILTIDEP